MKLKHLFSALLALALIGFTACQNDNGVEGGKATFKLNLSDISVDAEGGKQTVEYTITNHESGAVVLTNCTENWIKDLSTATFGSITFTVAPNYKQEAREARIKVEYTAVDAKYEILVKQEASDKAPFTYDIAECKESELVLNITPADISSAYVCQAYTKAHVEAFGLNDDNTLYAYDKQVFASDANYYGQTLLNYLQNIAHSGKAFDVTFSGLTPDTDYVVYCYHIDLSSGQPTSDVYRQVVRTAKPSVGDTTFEMSFEVSGAYIKQTITPSDAEAYYYVDFMSVNDFNSYYGNVDMAQTFVNKWNENASIKKNMGYSPLQIIEQYGKQGTQVFEYSELKAETEYVFYVFAISKDTAFTASDITLERVTTEAATASSMTITIEVKNIFMTTADIYWTASDPNGKFARSVLSKAEWDACGSSDAERFASFEAKGYGFWTPVGSDDLNFTKGEPGATFVAFAYGLDGDTPNTRIFTKEFKFMSDTPGTSNISLSYEKHYNLAEVATVDPTHWGSYTGYESHALVPFNIEGVVAGDEVYFMLDTRPLDWYSKDSQWLSEVAQEKNRKNLYSNCYMQLEYEREYIIIAVAKDNNGNFGELFKTKIYLYKSDSSDVADYEYVEQK